MGDMDSDANDLAGEFQYFESVASPYGVYSYSEDVWNNAMQDGYGGGITEGADGSLLNSNGEIVGYTSILSIAQPMPTFCATGNCSVPNVDFGNGVGGFLRSLMPSSTPTAQRNQVGTYLGEALGVVTIAAAATGGAALLTTEAPPVALGLGLASAGLWVLDGATAIVDAEWCRSH